MERRDDQNLTALARAVKGSLADICTILIKNGANMADESVQTELSLKPMDQRQWIKEEIARWRHYLVLALREVMEMILGVGDNKVYETILDFTMVSDQIVSL